MTLNPSATPHFRRQRGYSGRPHAVLERAALAAGNAVADRVKFFRRTLVVSIFVCALGVQTGEALQVSPARTEIRLSPGKDIKSIITVTNDVKDPVNVTLSTKDWFVLEANKDIHIDQWLRIKGKKAFRLNPGESRQIPIIAQCAKTAQGELVGMVSFAYVGDQPSMITPVISVSVYVAVAGTEKIAGAIKEVAVGKWQGKMHLAALVTNTGNIHLRPSGKITIVDDGHQPIATYPIVEGDPVYPGKERGYFCPPPDVKLPQGHYVAQAELTDHDLVMKGEKEFTVEKDGSIQMTPEKTSKT